MKEVCSCGASFAYKRPRSEYWNTTTAERLLLDWRENHRHEMPEAETEQPLIHESGSSHERAGDEYAIADRQPFGFHA